MSGHRVLHDLANATFLIDDPGDAGTIRATKDRSVCQLTSGSGAETRTLADPPKVGVRLTVSMTVDGGGAITMTADTQVDNSGNTAMTISEVGDWVDFVAIDEGGTLQWRIVGGEGVTGTVDIQSVNVGLPSGLSNLGTTAQAAFTTLNTHLTSSQVVLQPISITEEDGTALTSWTAGATPGWKQLSNKEVVLAWDGNAAPTAVAATFVLPNDLDSDSDVEVKYLARMAGATDTPVIVTECYFNSGDTDCAGTDDEVDGGTTLTEYTVDIDSGDVPDGPAHLTVILDPTDGEMGTDELYIYSIWCEYTRKKLTS